MQDLLGHGEASPFGLSEAESYFCCARINTNHGRAETALISSAFLPSPLSPGTCAVCELLSPLLIFPVLLCKDAFPSSWAENLCTDPLLMSLCMSVLVHVCVCMRLCVSACEEAGGDPIEIQSLPQSPQFPSEFRAWAEAFAPCADAGKDLQLLLCIKTTEAIPEIRANWVQKNFVVFFFFFFV